MDLAEYSRLQPNVQVLDLAGNSLTWLTPNPHVEWRAETLYSKEPDTVEWLRSMKPGEVLFDVGSNCGQYAMLAARHGLKVHAFEPEAQNFALLVRNLAINNLGDSCVAWPLALSNIASLDILHLSTLMPGGSCHAYGENKDFRGETKQFPFRQGSVATTLDYFTAYHGYPDHIKIDVDGFEPKVIRGGTETIKRARSVLIEINRNLPSHLELISYMTNQLGFNYDAATAEAARRKEGPFTNVGNIIFKRD